MIGSVGKCKFVMTNIKMLHSLPSLHFVKKCCNDVFTSFSHSFSPLTRKRRMELRSRSLVEVESASRSQLPQPSASARLAHAATLHSSLSCEGRKRMGERCEHVVAAYLSSTTLVTESIHFHRLLTFAFLVLRLHFISFLASRRSRTECCVFLYAVQWPRLLLFRFHRSKMKAFDCRTMPLGTVVRVALRLCRLCTENFALLHSMLAQCLPMEMFLHVHYGQNNNKFLFFAFKRRTSR